MTRTFLLFLAAALLVPQFAQALPLRDASACPTPPPCNAVMGLANDCQADPNNCARLLKTLSELELPYDCHMPKEGKGIITFQLDRCAGGVQEKAFDAIGHSPNADAKNHFCSADYAKTLEPRLAEIYRGPKPGEENSPYYNASWTQCPVAGLGVP